MSFIDVVIDLSHHNQADLNAVKAGGISGMFHKATQGLTFKDSLYQSRCQQAQAAGLLWGAYHFGTAADGVAQADFFLSTVGSTDGILLVLDLEENMQGASMTLDQAKDFVNRLYEVTGSWPGVYGGSYLKTLLNDQVDPVLQNCWFWLARYASNAIVPKTWSDWTFWQYTETGSVPGVTGNCDRDRFNGTQEQLAAFWPAVTTS